MRPAPGDVIGGKYQIVRLIGDGGMGTVYEAQHQFLETTVALKFLHTELAKRPGLGSRFLQEARVSARIKSPHVAHVTDVDQTPDGTPYLVMDLLHGEPLQQLMDRRGKLPVEQALDFGMQILSGLESAHAIGVVHRDLKPDNVFIVPATGGPLLKLIDFGIAKLRASTEFQKGLTRAGSVMGTPEYMAPEQLYSVENVDHRADLYSLAVMLFEMIAGCRPADGDDVETIVHAVAAGNVRRLGVLEPSLDPALVAVIERSLAPDREARFATALDMRLALAPFAHAPLPPAEVNNPTAAAQAFDAERLLPKTLPTEAVPPSVDAKGTTQRASDDAVREALRASALPEQIPASNVGYLPTAVAPAPVHQARRRKSRTGLWIALSLLLLLGAVGAVIALVLYQQEPRSAGDLPILDPPAAETTVNPLVDASPNSVSPSGDLQPNPTSVPTPTPWRPSSSTPTKSPGLPRLADAGAATVADAGRTTLPFPFPLPSVLPPLPSAFPPLPSAFPTAFPTALPSGFPSIPGLPFPRSARDGG